MVDSQPGLEQPGPGHRSQSYGRGPQKREKREREATAETTRVRSVCVLRSERAGRSVCCVVCVGRWVKEENRKVTRGIGRLESKKKIQKEENGEQ